MNDSTARRAKATPRVQLKSGRVYWEPSVTLRRAGFKGCSLGALCPEALNRADDLNAAADAHLNAEARPAPATVAAIIDAYLLHDNFLALRTSTQTHYRRHLRAARAKFGAKLGDQLTPDQIETWARTLGGATDARHHLDTLRACLGWAMRKEKLLRNPASEVRRSARTRRRRIATRDELWAIVNAADRMGRQSIAAYAITAVATMQREGDVLSLERSQVEAGVLHLRQSKTLRELSFRLHPIAVDRLALHTETAGPLFLNERTGQPYGERAFQRAWKAVRAAAAAVMPSLEGSDTTIRDANYKGALFASDMRRTGMVWSAEAGAQIAEICSVSGHTIDEGLTILEHYLPRHRLLADRAIARLDMIKTPTIEDIGLNILAA